MILTIFSAGPFHVKDFFFLTVDWYFYLSEFAVIIFSPLEESTCLNVKKPTVMFRAVESNLCQHQAHSPQVSPLIFPFSVLFWIVYLPSILTCAFHSCQTWSGLAGAGARVSARAGNGRENWRAASPSQAVTSDQMSAGTSHPILNESLLGGLTPCVCLCVVPQDQKKNVNSHNKSRVCSKRCFVLFFPY